MKGTKKVPKKKSKTENSEDEMLHLPQDKLEAVIPSQLNTPIIEANSPSQFGMQRPTEIVKMPAFYNPYLHQSGALISIPSNMNYMDAVNQGIFIPRRDNEQYCFIPGNIINTQSNITSHSHILVPSPVDDPQSSSHSSMPMIFVPKNSEQEEQDNENDQYETFIVPIKIKKEDNGSIELLPEPVNDPMPTNPEQINLLRKIYFLKQQQQKDDKKEDVGKTKIMQKDPAKVEKNNSVNQEIISNIKDKSKAFMMVRFHKKTILEEIDKNIIPKVSIEDLSTPKVDSSLTNVSLQISASTNRLSKISQNSTKKKFKTSKLRLSGQSDRNSQNLNPVSTSTSRFRRLRIDDKTRYWTTKNVSCRDYKMRVLPDNILAMSDKSTINVPESMHGLTFDHNILPSFDLTTIPSCDHAESKIQTSKGKWRYWRYMCSMNNCEFSKLRMELETPSSSLSIKDA